MGIEDLIQRFRRGDHIKVFKSDVEVIATFKKAVAEMPCVACKQKTLTLKNFNRGPKGWEAMIECSNCNFRAVINSTGFDAKTISSKGKARE